MSVVHDLKIGPLFFAAVAAGEKRAELRWNDRGFKCGDLLNLREWEGEYSGKALLVKVTHILPVEDFVIQGGNWVMMSIVPAAANEETQAQGANPSSVTDNDLNQLIALEFLASDNARERKSEADRIYHSAVVDALEELRARRKAAKEGAE